jgi:GxxExxY protein
MRMQHPLNVLTELIIGAAIDVHREIGPGLLENAYEACLAFELLRRNLNIERQKPLPICYQGQRLDCGYRIDLLVEAAVIVEIKSVEKLDRVHFAQMLSYLRFADCHVGLLVNFNVAWLSRDGIKRIVHDFPA